MWLNYLKVAFRSLFKNGFYSFINILGLAIGLACCLLIMLYVQHQLSFDQFHAKADRLYRVVEDQHYSHGEIMSVEATPGPLAPALVAEIPQIENASRATWNLGQNFFVEGKAFEAKGHYVDAAFLDMFSIEFIAGQKKAALKDISSIAISEGLAVKLFGSTDVIGKTISVENEQEVKVTAVFEEMPANSSLQFDFLLPYDLFFRSNGWLESWGNNGIRTYVMLHEKADAEQAKAVVKNYLVDRGAQENTLLYLQPIKDMHLYSKFTEGKNVSGRIVLVRLFTGIAVFLLIIACINFMNLSTARSGRRSREVGVRKAIGAYKNQLVTQFLSESLVISFIAALLALLLAQLALPVFNSLTGFQLAIPFTDPFFMLLFGLLVILAGFLAGGYPAFLLSSFNTIEILKGKLSPGRGSILFRKGLVIFQFFISIVLIVGTLVVGRQIHYMKNKDLGLSVDNVLLLPMNNELRENFEPFQLEMNQQHAIVAVSGANQIPFQIGNNSADVHWPGKSVEDNILFQKLRTDAWFVDALKVKLLEGRNFRKESKADTNNFIVNEKAVALMRLENPVGAEIEAFGHKGQIVGVVEDFHTSTVQNAIDPLIISLSTGDRYHAFVRLKEPPVPAMLERIEAIYRQHSPSFPFQYTLLKDNYQNMYNMETLIGKLTTYFSILALVISCLGLLGLAAYSTEQRRKEIGVRKVMGASVSEIVLMLSAGFSKWVGIAFVFAAPFSWWLMELFLSNYAYRIEVGVYTLLLAGGIAFVLALLTVSYLSFKAATLNPALTLKED
ncbi:ABC transporter permease [Nafulsella turpanensis]|uniref:ABC transporter permease n=1 Tax=Nafulsella turpanensis TaxID=1265690 RepID=UPI00036CDF9D|nr:ABC transporter permease [Nafulsella turpanensis]